MAVQQGVTGALPTARRRIRRRRTTTARTSSPGTGNPSVGTVASVLGGNFEQALITAHFTMLCNSYASSHGITPAQARQKLQNFW